MTADFHSSFLFLGFLVYACFTNGGCNGNSIEARATDTMPTIVELVSVENTTSDVSNPNKAVVYETIDDDLPHRVDHRSLRSRNHDDNGSSSTTNLSSNRTTTETTTLNHRAIHNSTITTTRLETAKTHKDLTKIKKVSGLNAAADQNRTNLPSVTRGKQKFQRTDGEFVNLLGEGTAATIEHFGGASANLRTTILDRQIATETDSDSTLTTEKQIDINNVPRGQKSSPAFHYRGGDGYEFETQFIADKDDDGNVRKFDKTRKHTRGGEDPENNIDRIRNYNANNINVKIGNVVKRPQGFSLTSTTTTTPMPENDVVIRKTLPKVTVRNGASVIGHHKLSIDENTSPEGSTVASSSSLPRENEIVKKPSIKLVSPSSSLSSNRRKTNTSNDNSLPTTSTAWALASLKTPIIPKTGAGTQIRPSSSVELSKRNNIKMSPMAGTDRTLTTITTNSFASTTIKPFVPWAVRLQKTTTEDQKDWTTTMKNLTDDVEMETVSPNLFLDNGSTIPNATNTLRSITTIIPTLKSNFETIPPHRVNTPIHSSTLPTISSNSPPDKIGIRIKETLDKSYSESLANNASNANTIPDVDVKTYTQSAASHITKSYDNFVKPTIATSTVIADDEKRHQEASPVSSSTVEVGKHNVVIQIHDLGLDNVDTLAPKFETKSTAAVEISTNKPQHFKTTTVSTYTMPQVPSKATTLKTDAYDEITRNLFGISSSTSQHGNDIDYIHSSESTTRSSTTHENLQKDTDQTMVITSTEKTIPEELVFRNDTINKVKEMEHIMQIGSSHEFPPKGDLSIENVTNNIYTSREGSDLDEATKTVPLYQERYSTQNGVTSHYDNSEQSTTAKHDNIENNYKPEETVVDIGLSVENHDHDQYKANLPYSDTAHKLSTTSTPYVQSTTNGTFSLKIQPTVDESTDPDNVYFEMTTLVDTTSEKLTTFSTFFNRRNHSKSSPSTTAYLATISTTSKSFYKTPSNVDAITVTSSTTVSPHRLTPVTTSSVSSIDNGTKAPKTTEIVETTASNSTPPPSLSMKPKLSPENIPGYLMLFFKSSFAEVCGTSAALKENLFQYITQRSLRIQSKDQVLMMVDPEQCKEPDNSVRLIPVALYIVDDFGSYDKNLIHEMKTLLEEEDLNNYTLPIHEIVYHENIIHDNSRIIAAMVITSVAAISFVLLLFLMCTIRNRQKLNYGQRCTPVSIDDFNLDNISEYNSIRRKSASRASKRSYGNPTFDDPAVPSKTLTFNGLLKACENRRNLDEEFSQIPVITVKPEELPIGAEVKNRYANVIPLPETRVSLSLTNKCSDLVVDYINANYVKGFKGADKFYIACQAPQQNTVEDFWKMVWKEQTKVVIMLTGLTENGIEKCADYLPPSEVLDCHRLFGDYQITLKKREVKEKYVISSLQLKNMENNLWREVTHLWYTNWPMQGVPNEQSSIIALLIEARAYMRNSKGPHVVHCSPGTGRTGTVIAIDICIRDYELTRSVNIPLTIARLRRCRAGAVQTKEQYAFIYKVLALYAKKLNGGTSLDSM